MIIWSFNQAQYEQNRWNCLDDHYIWLVVAQEAVCNCPDHVLKPSIFFSYLFQGCNCWMPTFAWLFLSKIMYDVYTLMDSPWQVVSKYMGHPNVCLAQDRFSSIFGYFEKTTGWILMQFAALERTDSLLQSGIFVCWYLFSLNRFCGHSQTCGLSPRVRVYMLEWHSLEYGRC